MLLQIGDIKSLCLITQASKLGYQPPSVAVTAAARESAYEPAMRDASLREMPPEAPVRQPLSSQSYHPGLMMLPRDTTHPALSYNSAAAAAAAKSAPSSLDGVPRTKLEMPSTASSIVPSPRVTELSPTGPDVRPSITMETVPMATHATPAPAVASAVTSAAHLSTFRSPVSTTAASTVPVVRRRTSDKVHLPIAMGE